MQPGIGEPTPPERRERLLCGLMSALPDQDGQMCERRAELHVLVRHRERGSLHQLLTCMVHYPTAVQAGERIADHKLGLWCGLPSTVFDPALNECVIDDSGTNPLTAESATTEAQPTDRYVAAVEMQRPAVEDMAKVMARHIAEGQRDRTIRATYQSTLREFQQDPATYTAVMVMALLMLAERES